jgi:hypothetical protein
MRPAESARDRAHAWCTRLLLLACTMALAACTLRPPVSGEERMADSTTLTPDLAQGTAPPFCLHLRYHNAFFVTMSDARTEAWVTEGRCDAQGGRRMVEAIRLSWWNDWHDTQNNRQCLNTDNCSINDTNVIVGQNIRCASAQARHGNQVAFITTDEAVCH